jgi:uncharacterized protein
LATGDRWGAGDEQGVEKPGGVSQAGGVNRLARLLSSALGLLLAVGMGCKPPASQAPSTSSANHGYLDHAQPRLPTVQVWLGAEQMVAEVARTAVQVETGLMYRTRLGENEGMLFVFPEPYQASFYMRNTLIPLSCAYINSDGVILEIHDMKPKDETAITAKTDQVRYVLETRQGWFTRHHIGAGTVVRTARGSLAETFWGRSDAGP